jgi:coenzyme F420-reducing hydrogenase alpha subunit
MPHQTINLNHITKIEGHASLHISLKKGKVEKCELGSIEGARYFEDLMVGRDYTEAFELSSRICGICSSAHTICAITAIENALGLKPSSQTFKLRELLTLGERIRSHATHLYFLALPDYLGFESALAMLPQYKPEIQCALRIMKTGNLIVKTIGGRDLHPVSAAVGGFVSYPTATELKNCLDNLLQIKKDSLKTANLFLTLKVIPFTRDIESFSLVHPQEYGMLRGDIKSNQNCFPQSQYDQFIKEYHEPYSTAKLVVKKDKEYRVGALARVNNNSRFLSPDAQKILIKSKIKLPSVNPFHNNIAQAIELIHAIDHAINLFQNLQIKPEKIKSPLLKKGRGVAGIEVPRGTLWHDYHLDQKGKITKANIITPTTQNLRVIQEDIRAFIPTILHLSQPEIKLEIEKLIRAYDPCFSCSTHFLDLQWEEK